MRVLLSIYRVNERARPCCGGGHAEYRPIRQVRADQLQAEGKRHSVGVTAPGQEPEHTDAEAEGGAGQGLFSSSSSTACEADIKAELGRLLSPKELYSDSSSASDGCPACPALLCINHPELISPVCQRPCRVPAILSTTVRFLSAISLSGRVLKPNCGCIGAC